MSVDGRPAQIVTANLLFHGVGLPAGEHAVDFTVPPLSADTLLTAAAGVIGRDAGEEETVTR